MLFYRLPSALTSFLEGGVISITSLLDLFIYLGIYVPIIWLCAPRAPASGVITLYRGLARPIGGGDCVEGTPAGPVMLSSSHLTRGHHQHAAAAHHPTSPASYPYFPDIRFICHLFVHVKNNKKGIYLFLRFTRRRGANFHSCNTKTDY